jgi:hypothetical protein
VNIASQLGSKNEGPAMPVGMWGHDGATGELFVKGGWGRAPGDAVTKSIFEVV